MIDDIVIVGAVRSAVGRAHKGTLVHTRGKPHHQIYQREHRFSQA